MSDQKSASAPMTPVVVAKKYRISLEDAKAILEQHGSDTKAVHRAARKVAA